MNRPHILRILVSVPKQAMHRACLAEATSFQVVGGGGVAQTGAVDTRATHLLRQILQVAHPLPRHKNIGGGAGAGHRHIAGLVAPMAGVQQIGLIQGLALPLINRAGIAKRQPAIGRSVQRPCVSP